MVYDDDTSPRVFYPIRSGDRPVTPVAEEDRPPTHIRALIGTLGKFAGYGPERVAATLEGSPQHVYPGRGRAVRDVRCKKGR